jgi:hypothetical protein
MIGGRIGAQSISDIPVKVSVRGCIHCYLPTIQITLERILQRTAADRPFDRKSTDLASPQTCRYQYIRLAAMPSWYHITPCASTTTVICE